MLCFSSSWEACSASMCCADASGDGFFASARSRLECLRSTKPPIRRARISSGQEPVYRGEWLSSFLWIREHTPKDAFFALDPEYLLKAGVDLHGFRALAERGTMADQEKDSGVASVFPELAELWKQQSAAQFDWAHVSVDRLQNLRAQYGVSWVLLENPAPLDGLVCPYSNGQLRVCQIVDVHRPLPGQTSSVPDIGRTAPVRTSSLSVASP